MPPRVSEKERLRHKVLISLNDEQYALLLVEARERELAPRIVGRLTFAAGMPKVRRKGRAARWREDEAGN